MVALVPILLLYARDRSVVQQEAGHVGEDFRLYAASLSDYLLPSPRNPLFHWLRGHRPADLTEHTLFAGYVLIAFALVAVWLIWRRDGWLRETHGRWWTAVFAAVLAPAAFLTSLPRSYGLGPVAVPMPSAAIGLLSGYWRVYSRFGVLVGFSLAVLAALALTALTRRPGRGRRLLAPLALTLVVLELLPGNVGAFATDARPAWVAWLAAAPKGIVATYPIPLGQPPATRLGEADGWYQTFDGHPRFAILGASRADMRSRAEAIRLLARDLDDPLAARVLATENVRLVVVHDDVYRADGQAVPTPDPARFTLLRRFGDVRIFSVHAPATDLARALAANETVIAALEGLGPPSIAYGGGFNPPEPYNGSTGRWLIQDGRLEIGSGEVPTLVRLTGIGFGNGASRVLEVEDGSGRVLARGPFPRMPSRSVSGRSRFRAGPRSCGSSPSPGPRRSRRATPVGERVPLGSRLDPLPASETRAAHRDPDGRRSRHPPEEPRRWYKTRDRDARRRRRECRLCASAPRRVPREPRGRSGRVARAVRERRRRGRADAAGPRAAARTGSRANGDAAGNGHAAAAATLAAPAEVDSELLGGVAAAMALVKAHRMHGHLAARLDPLGSEPVGDPALDPTRLEPQLTPELQARVPASVLRIHVEGDTLAEALPRLQETYCGSIAYEIEHIGDHEQRVWLRKAIESWRFRRR